MPDDNSETGNDANNGGYGGSGSGFGGGDPGFGGVGGGSFSSTDAVSVAAVLGGTAMTVAGFVSGQPAVTSVGMSVTGLGLLGSMDALDHMGNTVEAIGNGTQAGLDLNAAGSVTAADLSAGNDVAVSAGPGYTDYFNSAGQLVGQTFDQAAYDAWAHPIESSSN